MSSTDKAPALQDVETKKESEAPKGPAKPHGEKLGAATDTASTAADASDAPVPGDSPKPHGDGMRRAVDEATKG